VGTGEHRPPTPIIALTAVGLEGRSRKVSGAGCTAFLTKPIKQEVLLQAIKEHSIVAPPSSKEESSRMDTIVVRANPKFCRPDPRVSAEPQAGCHRDAGRLGSG
jgi:DNA-binding response OmpR family regulator